MPDSIKSAEQIFAADQLPRELVDTTKWWGAPVWVRALTAYERVEWAQLGSGNSPLAGCYLAAMTIVDEDGKRIFEGMQAEALSQLNGEPIGLVVQTALRLSGLLAGEGVEEGKGD